MKEIDEWKRFSKVNKTTFDFHNLISSQELTEKTTSIRKIQTTRDRRHQARLSKRLSKNFSNK